MALSILPSDILVSGIVINAILLSDILMSGIVINAIMMSDIKRSRIKGLYSQQFIFFVT